MTKDVSHLERSIPADAAAWNPVGNVPAVRGPSRRRLARRRRTGRPHAGITLIEVLISVGVLTIGVLGVTVILLPLANHQARQGLQEDRKAAAGMRAYREFKIRGMSNPENWVGDAFEPFGELFRVRRAAYCLDPLGVAATGSDMFPNQSANPSGTTPWMRRITLSAAPGRGTLKFLTDASRQGSAAAAVPMSLAQATEALIVQDDLMFSRPEDEALPPQQDWLLDASNVAEKRLAEGKFSWFATLVPEPNVDNDEYRLSIAVARERVPEEAVAKEQAATVKFLGAEATGIAVAFAGGDVELTSAVPIEARSGDWLVLSQQVPMRGTLPPGAQPPPPQFDFRWYRIVMADERDGSTVREFTLQGPDWQIYPTSPTTAILVPQIRAVYEKTVRLESSSLWTSFSTL